jgi:hypothetical protein
LILRSWALQMSLFSAYPLFLYWSRPSAPAAAAPARLESELGEIRALLAQALHSPSPSRSTGAPAPALGSNAAQADG